MTYENYQKFVLPLLKNHGAENFTTVAIVREPIEWFSSWYRYNSKPKFKIRNPKLKIGIPKFKIEIYMIMVKILMNSL